MTTAHVQKFAEMILNAPALYSRVNKYHEDMSVYASTAVQEGKALGLVFTAHEFTTFVMEQPSTDDWVDRVLKANYILDWW